MAHLETVLVKGDTDTGSMIINKSDLTEDHTLIKPEKPKPDKQQKAMEKVAEKNHGKQKKGE